MRRGVLMRFNRNAVSGYRWKAELKIDALSFAVVAAEQSCKPMGPEELRNQFDARAPFSIHLELAVMMAAALGVMRRSSTASFS